jgi:hypothetical protein
MSDLGFDPRGYCERLAKASKRFTFGKFMDSYEGMLDYIHDANIDGELDDGEGHNRIDSAWSLWAFFGPLADERKIAKIYRATVVVKVLGGLIPMSTGYDTLLESTIAAVVESFESEVKS